MTDIEQDRQDQPVGDYDMDEERVVEQDAAQALDGPQIDEGGESLADDEDALEADELGADEDGYV